MTILARLPSAKRVKVLAARGISCALLLALPACQIPNRLPADAGPALPAEYNVPPGTATGPTAPAVVPTSATAVVPAGGPAATPAVPAGATAAKKAISGATLVPVGGTAGGAASVAVAACVDNSTQIPVEEFYTDPLLLRLIQKAVADNRELKNLELETQVAANEVLARRGAYLPLVSFGANSGFEKTSKFTRNGSVEDQLLLLPKGRTFPDPLPNTRVGVNVDWTLDIWRLLRNSRDAAIQRFQSAVERRNDFVTRLIADVAENYYALMALDKRMENLDQIITLQEQSYEIAKARVQGVRGNLLAVQRFEADLRRNRSEKLVIKQEIIETENRINLLINRYPEPVERSSAGFYDLMPPALTVGLPSQLLLNRPDIRRAERELAAAGLDVKVARARFFPQLSISAGVGYEAFNPRYLFNPEAFAANAAGNLVAPLVNKRAIQAEFLTANARQLQALYDYQRLILTAFTEVVNQVTMAENYRQTVALRKQQLESLSSAIETADRLFVNTRVEYIEVLFTQRDLRDARTGLIDAKRQQLTAVVRAYQALGGGGNMLPPPTPIIPITGLGHGKSVPAILK